MTSIDPYGSPGSWGNFTYGTGGNTVTAAAGPVNINGQPATFNTAGWALCPDLLTYERIGLADGWRGRVVRAFFWLMRAWPSS